MSVLSTIMIVIGVLFLLLLVVPRVIMGIRTAQLKGKPAPVVHKPSAARIKSGKKTILYFYTPPCGACKMQEPIVKRIQKKYPQAVFKIDASRNHEAASAYGVMGVPFLAFIEEGKLISAKAGVQPESSLATFLAD